MDGRKRKKKRTERCRRKEATEKGVLEFAGDRRKRKKMRDFVPEGKIKMKFAWDTSHAKY